MAFAVRHKSASSFLALLRSFHHIRQHLHPENDHIKKKSGIQIHIFFIRCRHSVLLPHLPPVTASVPEEEIDPCRDEKQDHKKTGKRKRRCRPGKPQRIEPVLHHHEQHRKRIHCHMEQDIVKDPVRPHCEITEHQPDHHRIQELVQIPNMTAVNTTAVRSPNRLAFLNSTPLKSSSSINGATRQV